MENEPELIFQDLTPNEFFVAAETIAENDNLEELTFENCSWVNAEYEIYGPTEIANALNNKSNLKIIRFKGVRSVWRGKGRESFHELIEKILSLESLKEIEVENANLLSKTIRLLRTSGKLTEYRLINNDRGYEKEESSSEEIAYQPITPTSEIESQDEIISQPPSPPLKKIKRDFPKNNSDNEEDNRIQYSQVLVPIRREQDSFRKTLLRIYENRCCITGDDIVETLEAAHILPVIEGGGYEVTNGLLMNMQWHRFFDLLMFYIDEDYCIHLCDKLYARFNVDGKFIRLPKSKKNYPSKELLAEHKQKALDGKYFQAYTD